MRAASVRRSPTPSRRTVGHVQPADTFWLATGLVAGGAVGVLIGVAASGDWYRRLAVALACAHIGAVLAVTLFPMPIAGAEPFQVPYSSVQLEPGRTIRMLFHGSQEARQLGGNLLLLAPMGFLVPIAWKAARPFAATVVVGLSTSLLIELLQFGAGVAVGEFYRVVDVDDVLLNTAGVVVGRLAFGIVWTPWNWLRSRRRVGVESWTGPVRDRR